MMVMAILTVMVTVMVRNCDDDGDIACAGLGWSGGMDVNACQEQGTYYLLWCLIENN